MATLAIDKFKSKLTGGGARTNYFEVELAAPAGVAGLTTFEGDDSILVKGAALPASIINPIMVPFRGRQLQVPGDRTFEPWTITVVNDTNFRLRDFFESWMNGLSDHVTGKGVEGNFDAFAVDMRVHQLNRAGDRVKSYTIHDAWCSNVAAIEVSYDSENTIEEFTVELQMTYWTATNSGSGQDTTTQSGAALD